VHHPLRATRKSTTKNKPRLLRHVLRNWLID
jgi:hypothetical protein